MVDNLSLGKVTISLLQQDSRVLELPCNFTYLDHTQTLYNWWNYLTESSIFYLIIYLLPKTKGTFAMMKACVCTVQYVTHLHGNKVNHLAYFGGTWYVDSPIKCSWLL